ncbi:MAG: hypothetical protein MJ175_13055, partial [Clostridia bacterium]|nr:hypothetical protein [Clostridia bacterium]
EIAGTAAAGGALADAGFGIHFTESSEIREQGVVDAPIGIPHGIERTSDTGEVTHGPKTGTAVSDAAKTHAPNACVNTDCRNAAAAYSAKSSVEEIMAVLTFEDALNVTIDSGFYRGKTLGQIAKEKPQSLDWYVNQYRGGNNILRAAARVLLDRAAV